MLFAMRNGAWNLCEIHRTLFNEAKNLFNNALHSYKKSNLGYTRFSYAEAGNVWRGPISAA